MPGTEGFLGHGSFTAEVRTVLGRWNQLVKVPYGGCLCHHGAQKLHHVDWPMASQSEASLRVFTCRCWVMLSFASSSKTRMMATSLQLSPCSLCLWRRKEPSQRPTWVHVCSWESESPPTCPRPPLVTERARIRGAGRVEGSVVCPGLRLGPAENFHLR